jgi:ferredoxin
MSVTPPFTIDEDLCVGHGRCYSLAPQAFSSDDMGLGHVKDALEEPGLTRAPAEVADACPEGAIHLTSAAKGSTP